MHGASMQLPLTGVRGSTAGHRRETDRPRGTEASSGGAKPPSYVP